MPYPRGPLLPDARFRSPTTVVSGVGELQSFTKLVHVVAGRGLWTGGHHDLAINAIKLVGPPPQPTKRCRTCGAPFEAKCSYCGSTNDHPDVELMVMCGAKDCSRFAVASLSPEPLKLKVAIPIARNDDLWFSVAPAQNMDFIVYGVMNKLL